MQFERLKKTDNGRGFSLLLFQKKNLPYVFLLALFGVLLFRTFYGFSWSDEVFYISSMQRFYQGDIPLLNEFMGTQLSSIVTLPLYYMFRFFSPNSNDGVVIYFRILYLVLSFVGACAIYSLLCKHWHNVLAAMSAFIFMAHTRANIDAPSYYSIAFWGFLLTIILIYDIFVMRKCTRWKAILAGIMFAISVPCLPYLVFLFAFVFLVCILLLVRKKLAPYQLKLFLWFVLGVIVVASIYCCYLFSKMSLAQFIDNVPNMFLLRTQQGKSNFIYDLLRFGGHIVFSQKYTIVISALTAIYLGYNKLKAKPLPKKVLIAVVMLQTLILIWEMIYCFVGIVHIARIAIPVSVFGLQMWLLLPLREKKIQHKSNLVMCILYIPSILFAVLFNVASNTGLSIISIAMVLAAIPSVFFIQQGFLYISCKLLIEVSHI
jgi:hypothetical protein